MHPTFVLRNIFDGLMAKLFSFFDLVHFHQKLYFFHVEMRPSFLSIPFLEIYWIWNQALSWGIVPQILLKNVNRVKYLEITGSAFLDIWHCLFPNLQCPLLVALWYLNVSPVNIDSANSIEDMLVFIILYNINREKLLFENTIDVLHNCSGLCKLSLISEEFGIAEFNLEECLQFHQPCWKWYFLSGSS